MMIDDLNCRVIIKLAPSSIHGIGVFATRDIRKFRKLYADRVPFPFKVSPGNLSKLLPDVRETLLERWPQIVNGAAFAYPDCIFQAYMNHSDSPNYDSMTDTALRDIKAGEEITEDYRQIPNWGQVYPWLS